eukprot:gene18232-20051_t
MENDHSRVQFDGLTETRLITRPCNALLKQPNGEDRSLETEAVHLESCEDKFFKQKAYKWCSSYLGGTWEKISFDQFNVQYVRGGLTNYLYLCSLPDSVSSAEKEQRKVLIRIYGEILDHKAKFYEGVIFTLLAERGIGPHLYGVFSSGRIEQYIPSRHLETKELGKPSLSTCIAKKLGQHHAMDLPLTKQPTWLWERIEDWLLAVQSDDYLPEKTQLTKLMKEINFVEEYSKLKSFLINTKSQVVFCHNDLQERNILLLEKNGTEDVLLIDYDYSSYNYRGFDIGNHFCERMYDYGNNDAPYFYIYENDYPTAEQQRQFAYNYFQSYNLKRYGSKQEPTEAEINQLLLEANRFALASHFFWAIWSIVQTRMSKIEFGYEEYCIARFNSYFRQKKIFWPDE